MTETMRTIHTVSKISDGVSQGPVCMIPIKLISLDSPEYAGGPMFHWVILGTAGTCLEAARHGRKTG